MRRNKFILAMLTAAPLTACAQVNGLHVQKGQGFKTSSGEGRTHGHIKLKGVNENVLDLKVSGKDTKGRLAIFEQTSLSPGRGTPLHIHHFQDEVFYVLDGEYVFQVGEEKFNLKTGDNIYLPMKVPHAWAQVSNRGKLMVILQPAGKLEDFFVTMAALKSEPTAKEIDKIFSDNEMQIVGPPLNIK